MFFFTHAVLFHYTGATEIATPDQQSLLDLGLKLHCTLSAILAYWHPREESSLSVKAPPPPVMFQNVEEILSQLPDCTTNTIGYDGLQKTDLGGCITQMHSFLNSVMPDLKSAAKNVEEDHLCTLVRRIDERLQGYEGKYSMCHSLQNQKVKSIFCNLINCL